MKLFAAGRSGMMCIALAGALVADIFALAGCVYYPSENEVFVGPPPVIGPSLNVGIYGTPAGYYYQNYPVFIYRNRPVYYYGGRRHYFHPRRYYWRRGYRYYY